MLCCRDDLKVRFLLLADSHLGFDLPRRPRVERRRRGHDFFQNYLLALEPALEGQVDCVIHGGDLLFRSKVPQQLLFEALGPLHRIAEAGIPVCIVPGNHERSSLPFPLLSMHPLIHIFRQPGTVVLEFDRVRASLSGFPQIRESVREQFPTILKETGCWEASADIRLLCMHQAVEGATVGPSGYVFRRGPDVIPGEAIPRFFQAVLTGHIHRAQILLRDLQGRSLGAPVIYPGSLERTSFAEKDEVKGYVTFEIARSEMGTWQLSNVEFHPLPTRPMFVLEVRDASGWKASLMERLSALPGDSVVQIRVDAPPAVFPRLELSRIRDLVGPEMDLSLRFLNRAP